MVQDQVSEQFVGFIFKEVKLSGRILARAMRAYHRTKNNVQKHEKPRKQSLKSLIKDGSKIESVELSDSGINDFDSIAKKYCLRYAVKADKTTNPPTHYVFFKSRDADNMTAAFSEYSRKHLTNLEKRQPLEEQIQKAKTQAQKHNEKISERKANKTKKRANYTNR